MCGSNPEARGNGKAGEALPFLLRQLVMLALLAPVPASTMRHGRCRCLLCVLLRWCCCCHSRRARLGSCVSSTKIVPKAGNTHSKTAEIHTQNYLGPQCSQWATVFSVGGRCVRGVGLCLKRLRMFKCTNDSCFLLAHTLTTLSSN